MRFRAISFDVDGTLFDLRQMKLAFAIPAIRNARLLKAYLAAREEVRGRGMVGDARGEQARLVGKALGIPPDEAAARIERLIDGEWMRSFARVKPFPGAREALAAISAAGIALVTVSDYPAAAKLAGMKLDHVPWTADVSAEALGALKPHRAAFDEAVRVLGVPPAEILHVGDRLDADIAGAQAVGMRTALFTAGNARKYAAAPDAAPPDLVFGAYPALLDFLEVKT